MWYIMTTVARIGFVIVICLIFIRIAQVSLSENDTSKDGQSDAGSLMTFLSIAFNSDYGLRNDPLKYLQTDRF